MLVNNKHIYRLTSINELDYPRHIEVEGVDVLGRKVHKEYKGIRIKINY